MSAARGCLTGLLVIGSASAAFGQEWLDTVDQALRVQSPGGALRSDLSVVIDLEGYAVDRRPPGVIFSDDIVNPRLSLFVDTRIGKRLYSLVQARVDRGFDPFEQPHEARLDEYLIRYMPFDGGALNLQAGKFATVFGGWVPRHLSWDNPFVNAPLPYENVTTITDAAGPASPQAFLARVAIADKKAEWVPVLWGPVYGSGASAFGSWKRLDYAVEMKNIAVSARPEVWGPGGGDWKHPNFAARLGHRPSAAWTLGVSWSRGPYMHASAASTLPPGQRPSGFAQTTVGGDAAFARRRLEVWSEVIFSRFQVPNVGGADVWSYYVESRYKVLPRLSAAVRWGRQRFGDVIDGAGGQQPWDAAIWRTDAALTFRWTRHLQAKLQYGFGEEDKAAAQNQRLVAVQATVKF
jgi:hypothetical protein